MKKQSQYQKKKAKGWAPPLSPVDSFGKRVKLDPPPPPPVKEDFLTEGLE